MLSEQILLVGYFSEPVRYAEAFYGDWVFSAYCLAYGSPKSADDVLIFNGDNPSRLYSRFDETRAIEWFDRRVMQEVDLYTLLSQFD
jgi:hypothetical protein